MSMNKNSHRLHGSNRNDTWSCRITLELSSDAEPGTGLGTNTLDDYVPVDVHGIPILPSTHIKGLARDAWRDIALIRGWDVAVEERLFGRAGNKGDDGQPGLLKFTHLTVSQPNQSKQEYHKSISTVTRTAVGEYGTAKAHSLRSVQRVHTGTKFVGSVSLESSGNSTEARVAQLALLAICAVGGNRTRGAGRCLVTLEGVNLSASQLLRSLDTELKEWTAPVADVHVPPVTKEPIGAPVLVELTYIAATPTCCPATPLAEQNDIVSGFAIPASAVQGAILTRLSRVDPALATECLQSRGFRAWPLLPCSLPEDEVSDTFPVHISFTHKISKLPNNNNEHTFQDSMIKEYHWRDVPDGAPLKGADGVLLASKNQVKLWRDKEMPRVLSAQVAVTPQGPQLYTVSSIAPMIFRGLAAIPQRVLNMLTQELKADNHVSFGRAKTVRGQGELSLRELGPASIHSIGYSPEPAASEVFVVQSPLEIPEDWNIGIAADVLIKLVKESGWGDVDEAHANIAYSFGWNRMGIGEQVQGTSRLKGVRVIAPGSVFRLKKPIVNFGEKLITGIGQGRERGFGAVLPHPGIASAVYKPQPRIVRLKSRDNAGKVVKELIKASEESGLSPSQIANIVSHALADRNKAIEFIERQSKERPPRQRDRWNPVKETLKSILNDKSHDFITLHRIFSAWKDNAVAKNKGDK